MPFLSFFPLLFFLIWGFSEREEEYDAGFFFNHRTERTGNFIPVDKYCVNEKMNKEVLETPPNPPHTLKKKKKKGGGGKKKGR